MKTNIIIIENKWKLSRFDTGNSIYMPFRKLGSRYCLYSDEHLYLPENNKEQIWKFHGWFMYYSFMYYCASLKSLIDEALSSLHTNIITKIHFQLHHVFGIALLKGWQLDAFSP